MAFNFKRTKDDEVNTVGTKANLEKLAGEVVDMNYTDFTEGEDYASLAKRYSTQGKKAMDDTVGQVAARTGGIASSYATAAGNQAYNGYMEKLEDAARAMYDDQRQEKVDNLGISKTLYDQNYQEKRDAVADEQWDKQYNYTVGQNTRNQLLQDAQVIWSTGGTLSDKQLKNLGIDRATEAAYRMYYTSQGGEDEPESEPFEQAIFLRYDDDLNAVYSKGGKEVTLRIGANPYNGRINSDLLTNGEYDESKAMRNTPHQPNNVGGKPLKKADYDGELYVNGVLQNVWTTEDGQWYYWDGTKNEYIKTNKEELDKISEG